MARIARMALDVALVSVKTVAPAVSTMWNVSKNALSNNARANKLLQHSTVQSVESKLSHHTESLIIKMTELRDRAIQKELTYLENEVEKIKSRIKKSQSDNKCEVKSD